MKAFSVIEKDDHIGGIYFANQAIAAKKKAASALDMDTIAGLKVKRVEWADKYAPGPVPHLALIDHGWRTYCDGCARDIGQDLILEERLSPVETPAGFFCDESCHRQALADEAERTRMESEAAGWLKAYMIEKHPDAVLSGEPFALFVKSKSGKLMLQSMRVDFQFPGAQYGKATIRFKSIDGEPEYTMCAGDREAWLKWNGKSSD